MEASSQALLDCSVQRGSLQDVHCFYEAGVKEGLWQC